MKIGFTGTRRGMTEKQSEAFLALVESLNAVEFHHGDCVGADDEAARLIPFGVRIVCHPPLDVSHRAFNGVFHEMREPNTHFARNRNIVDSTDVLIAAPAEMEHQERGGTWYTHDYAIKKLKPVYVVWPDGSLGGKS